MCIYLSCPNTLLCAGCNEKFVLSYLQTWKKSSKFWFKSKKQTLIMRPFCENKFACLSERLARSSTSMINGHRTKKVFVDQIENQGQHFLSFHSQSSLIKNSFIFEREWLLTLEGSSCSQLSRVYWTSRVHDHRQSENMLHDRQKRFLSSCLM